MVPPLFPADLVVIPVSAMLVYQYFIKWSSFLIANTLWALTFAYIIVPLAIKVHMFHMDNWKHTYSFIGFFVLGITVRCIILFLLRKLEKA
ncbi:CBO0543 family protein [Robertmurraya korlensis]|uniref:CBO0543 family protein n=1 Tax=Robertmurraya korlensis TaxID=519977 RepID=UPI000AFCD8B0